MVDAGAFDGLWGQNTGGSRWTDSIPPDQRKWLDELAALIVKKNTEPNWVAVGIEFRNKFGLGLHPVDSTLTSSIRRIVDQS